MGAILAYLFSGIVIGPFVFGFIKEAEVILHFSELGVVFLLFVIGLELAPNKLWQLRHSIFGLGLSQMAVTGFALMGLFLLAGYSLPLSYAIGFGLALSSTAFAIQILKERRQLNTTYGQGAFSILMFQDLAVVPLLASLTLFSQETVANPFTWFDLLKAGAVIVVVILAGRYLIRYPLRLIAASRIPEVFTATALIIVVGSALLMEEIGLSMGMGAFLAGVLLANSEYRHELETSLSPFKGLLLGLFFIAVGMSLNLKILLLKPHWVLLIALGFMVIKGSLIFGLARLFKTPTEAARNMAVVLPQGGEFAFVVFAQAASQGLLDNELKSILNASVTLSMALTPLIVALNQKWFRRFSEITERPYDLIQSKNPEVIIAGYGRFGQIVARFLRAQDTRCTILEHSAAQVEVARRFGTKIYYGDAQREDILHSAGAEDAKVFVLAIDEPTKSLAIAKLVRKKFPHLKIIARARNRQHALDLMELGITHIHRETFLTSLEVAKEIMVLKGDDYEMICRQLARFREHDESILANQFKVKHDEKKFLSYTSKANQELEQILRADRKGQGQKK